MKTCMREGCPVAATREVRLRMWARGYEKSARTRAEGQINLRVCEAHAAALTVEQVVSDEGWAWIVTAFADNGRAVPDRDSVEIYTVPLVPEGTA